MRFFTILLFAITVGFIILPVSVSAESAPRNKNQGSNTSIDLNGKQKNEKALKRIQNKIKAKKDRLQKRIAKKKQDNRPMDKRALAGFICGIFGILLPCAICALIFSGISRKFLMKNSEYKGLKLANAGWILGFLWILIYVFIAAVAI